MKFFLLISFAFLIIFPIHSLKYPSNFLQISDLSDSSIDLKKNDQDEDSSLSDTYDSTKSKSLGGDLHIQTKLHDPLDDLKDFSLKDLDLSSHKPSKKSRSYDDLDDTFNKKLEALDKQSEGLYTSLVPKSKDSKDKDDLDDEDDETIKKPLKAEELLAAAESKLGSHKNPLGEDARRRAKHRFAELDAELPKPKKFDDMIEEEPLVSLDEDSESSKPKEEHHSQAYLRHLDQIKKQKVEDAVIPPAQKDPILGSFVKNLQTIAAGENVTLSENPSLHLPGLTPFNSVRDTLSQNYVDADKSLIKNLLNKNVFNNLPGEVRNLVKLFQNKYKINETVTEIDPTKYFDSNNASLTPSSQPFVDPLGKIGRRGFLTLVNATGLTSESVWTILNGKVFCIYNSEDYVSIYRLYRNSALKFHDMIGTPCFVVFMELENQREMLCGSSIHEKEMWLQAFLAANPKSYSSE